MATLEGRVRALEMIVERLTSKTLDKIADTLASHGKALEDHSQAIKRIAGSCAPVDSVAEVLRNHKEVIGEIEDDLDDHAASLKVLSARACTEIVRGKEARP